MSPCPGCEALPESLSSLATLYVWPALGHTGAKLADALAQRVALQHDESTGAITMPLTRPVIDYLGGDVYDDLSCVELDDSRALALPTGQAPSPGNLSQVASLAVVCGRAAGGWLIETLQSGRLKTYFQPIVEVAAPQRVFAYECLLRGETAGGDCVTPSRLFQAARRSKMVFQLDRAARMQHIRAVNEAAPDALVFINLNPTAIYDPAYCLQSTIAAIQKSGRPTSQFIFEIVESDEVEDVDHLLHILDFYRNTGFRVALDDLGAGYGSLNLMSRLRPDFVKIDAELIRDIHRNDFKAQIVAGLLTAAAKLGVRTVIEGVETEDEWRWAVKHGADLAQGYFFGRPAPTPEAPAAREPVAASR